MSSSGSPRAVARWANDVRRQERDSVISRRTADQDAGPVLIGGVRAGGPQ